MYHTITIYVCVNGGYGEPSSKGGTQNEDEESKGGKESVEAREANAS
jgi:hypothetical protein